MRQPLSRQAHGFGDYAYVVVVGAAPGLLGFEDEPGAVLTTRILAGGILASSLFTRAEWGLVKAMPYRNHLGVDVFGGAVALAAPWAMGFSANVPARRFFLGVAAVAAVVRLLSRSEEM